MIAQARKRMDSPATLVVLGLVTVLIWLFAESQTLARVEVETVVRLDSPDGLLIVSRWADGRAAQNVTLTLEGPRNEIDSAAARLRRDGVALSAGAAGGPGSAAGVYELEVAESVQASAAAQLGTVAVVRGEPVRFSVEVDALKTLTDVPVIFDASRFDLADPPVIEPATVEITGPELVLGKIESAPNVVARVDQAAVDALRPGVTQRIEARLEVAGLTAVERSRVVVLPGRVGVRLTVRSRVSTIDVASAPVQVLGLPTDFAQWHVTPASQFVDGLTVTGPSDLIERIRSQELNVVAVVRLTSDELQRGVTEKEATFALLTADGLAPAPASLVIEGPGEPIGLTVEVVGPGDGGGGAE